MIDINQLTKGQAVRYRPSPVAQETLPGTFVSKAKGKEPAAMIQFQEESEPRVVYLSKLELSPEPKGDAE